MAIETVNQRDDDTEDRANEAAALGDLVLWVSQARDLLGEIRNAAGFEGSSLGAALKRLDIRYHTADWNAGDAGGSMSFRVESNTVTGASPARTGWPAGA